MSGEVRLTIWRLEKARLLHSGEGSTEVASVVRARAAFLGRGALLTDGRWHRRGTPVAYAGEHPAVAALEKLAWLESYERARSSRFVLVPLVLDPQRHVEVLDPEVLPEDWDAFPHPSATQAVGMRWVREARSVALAVPSALLPMAKNYLVNPFHPDFAALEVGEPVPYSWDSRLFKRG